MRSSKFISAVSAAMIVLSAVPVYASTLKRLWFRKSGSRAEGYDNYLLVWDNGDYIFDIFFTYTLPKNEAENIVKSAK